MHILLRYLRFHISLTDSNKSYGLHENMKINITDLFVVKYKDNAQNHLEMHCDGSFLSFNILLSDKNDFEGARFLRFRGIFMRKMLRKRISI